MISDLHLGGRYPTPEHPRGFRMCTRARELAAFTRSLPAPGSELVINGDFVDFLAEEQRDGFHPRCETPDVAVALLRALADPGLRPDEADFVDALRTFRRDTGCITILAGNHDAELLLPSVQAELTAVLGGAGTGLQIITTQTYRLADLLIEHGNQHDGFNNLDERSWNALVADSLTGFDPPPGSHIVAEVMNPIKIDFPFIDLLKPELEAAVPVLLALDPSQKRKLGVIAKHWLAGSRRNARIARGIPMAAANGPIADSEQTPDQALEVIVARHVVSAESRQTLMRSEADARPARSVNMGARSARSALGLLALLVSSRPRLQALHDALSGLAADMSFEQSVETDPRFVAGATHPDSDVSLVVMGHTHLAKDVDLWPGRRYINTGTWTDLIQFPEKILQRPDELTKDAAVDRLGAFLRDMKDLREGEPSAWISFAPTYAHVEIRDGRVVAGRLRRYRGDR